MLGAAVEAVAAGVGRAVVVEGAAGIGKTTLVEAARALRVRGGADSAGGARHGARAGVRFWRGAAVARARGPRRQRRGSLHGCGGRCGGAARRHLGGARRAAGRAGEDVRRAARSVPADGQSRPAAAAGAARRRRALGRRGVAAVPRLPGGADQACTGAARRRRAAARRARWGCGGRDAGRGRCSPAAAAQGAERRSLGETGPRRRPGGHDARSATVAMR